MKLVRKETQPTFILLMLGFALLIVVGIFTVWIPEIADEGETADQEARGAANTNVVAADPPVPPK